MITLCILLCKMVLNLNLDIPHRNTNVFMKKQALNRIQIWQTRYQSIPYESLYFMPSILVR